MTYLSPGRSRRRSPAEATVVVLGWMCWTLGIALAVAAVIYYVLVPILAPLQAL